MKLLSPPPLPRQHPSRGRNLLQILLPSPKQRLRRASGQIPTDGSTLDDNSNKLWTSGSCTIEFIPNGGSPNGNDVLGIAQSFLSDCCSGDSCSGVAYDTESSTALQNGCLCFHGEGKTTCICGAGTPSMTCI
ncbi:hypothetical protein N7532_006379 [Penicillium argentinense]|uniref:Uncharacterized protein n=1 Tax=Penicillium argentinense TaxID=1131581 RepID=A0A9W9FFR4_9EURO|nr:uncharacterized protein N7532_006379 [Penicillium argentinense]KAJ5099378.1 hypothetical protein N7532_006379 [Penicillium argentinense]